MTCVLDILCLSTNSDDQDLIVKKFWYIFYSRACKPKLPDAPGLITLFNVN